MVARPEGLSTVSETPDDKIELLVRSVLTAVDMRLGEVRHEMHAVAAESEQRHRQVLQYMRDLEHRLERRSDDASPLSGTGDSLAQPDGGSHAGDARTHRRVAPTQHRRHQ